MIILLKGGLSTLDRFIDSMAIDNDVLVLNLRDAEKAISKIYEINDAIDENSIVITFNSVGANLNLMGVEYWKAKGAKVVNILVDHPIYHIRNILSQIHANYYIGLIDIGHVEFLKSILPQFSSNFFFVPHGGFKVTEDISEAGKTIDVLYAGSFFDMDSIVFPNTNSVDAEDFYAYVIDYYTNNKYVEIHEAVDAYIEERQIKISAEERIVLIDSAIFGVEKSFITERRIELITRLAVSFRGTDYRIHVCGNKLWNDVVTEYKDTIIYHGECTPDECLNFIKGAKILINDMPYFGNGSHERIFNGMLNKSVVLSNESKYLESRFEDMKDILYWDGKDYQDAITKIHKVLENDDIRKSISEKAYAKVQNDTWSDRLRMVVNK